MAVIHGLDRIGPAQRGAAVTIGNFDGVHVGHQKIISRLAAKAGEHGLASMAITFEPHPVKVLAPDRPLPLMCTTEQRADLLRRYGADHVLFIDFTAAFAQLSADEFIEEVLVKKLGVRAVVVGHNYAFGRGKRGNTDLLRRRGRRYGFSVNVVRHAKRFGKVVSSSRTRNLISNGRMAKVRALLDRPYTVHGTVVRGAGRGESILSTPTANITAINELIPADGVYAARAAFGHACHEAVVSIGNNPTFENASRSFEVHLLDYRGSLLGRELSVDFIDRLRGEKKFSSPDELREQIMKDIACAREILLKAR